jgi:hypothetical protein
MIMEFWLMSVAKFQEWTEAKRTLQDLDYWIWRKQTTQPWYNNVTATGYLSTTSCVPVPVPVTVQNPPVRSYNWQYSKLSLYLCGLQDLRHSFSCRPCPVSKKRSLVVHCLDACCAVMYILVPFFSFSPSFPVSWIPYGRRILVSDATPSGTLSYDYFPYVLQARTCPILRCSSFSPADRPWLTYLQYLQRPYPLFACTSDWMSDCWLFLE